MLTLDLLRTRVEGGSIAPRYVDVGHTGHLRLARALIDILAGHSGDTRGCLQTALEEYAGDRVNYRIQRGLTKLLLDDSCTFDVAAVLAPQDLRRSVFAAARRHHPVVGDPDLFHGADRAQVLAEAAAELGLTVGEVDDGLYADLSANHRLVKFDPPPPAALLERYNEALAQAMLYRCRRLLVDVSATEPVRFRQLFAAIKLNRLIHTVTRTDQGFRIVLDGPMSLFRHSLRYGVRMAAFLPSLLQCRGWRLQADVPDDESRGSRRFSLDESVGLVSHHKAWTAYDSQVEATFARRFEKLSSAWTLTRETDFVDLKESVLIPDFSFRHEDGRTRMLEIVGYWRPEYLARKLDKLQRAGRVDLMVAVSERLNVSREEISGLPGEVIWFKGRLDPKEVLVRLD